MWFDTDQWFGKALTVYGEDKSPPPKPPTDKPRRSFVRRITAFVRSYFPLVVLMPLVVATLLAAGVYRTFVVEPHRESLRRQEVKQIVESGRRAARAGVPPEANPYQHVADRRAWLHGWVSSAEEGAR